MKRRLDENLEYFQRKRIELLTDSQIKIRYHWLKYKKRMSKTVSKVSSGLMSSVMGKSRAGKKRRNEIKNGGNPTSGITGN